MEVLHCMNKDFRPLSLQWPWPWSDDLHIRTRPVFSGDILYVPKFPTSRHLKVIVWHTYMSLHTYIHIGRQTDRHERNYIPPLRRRFECGQLATNVLVVHSTVVPPLQKMGNANGCFTVNDACINRITTSSGMTTVFPDHYKRTPLGGVSLRQQLAAGDFVIQPGSKSWWYFASGARHALLITHEMTHRQQTASNRAWCKILLCLSFTTKDQQLPHSKAISLPIDYLQFCHAVCC